MVKRLAWSVPSLWIDGLGISSYLNLYNYSERKLPWRKDQRREERIQTIFYQISCRNA